MLFSTGGAALKACSLGPWPLAGMRSLIAAVALLSFLPEARRGWTWRATLTGLAYAATLITFVLANKWGPAANAIFLQATAPLYLLLLGPLLLHEKLARKDFFVLACIATGLVLMLSGEGSGGWAWTAGDLMGLLSGVAWACLLTGLRWLARSGDRGTAEASVTLGNLITFAVCLPVAGNEALGAFELKNALILLYLGVFQIALAYVLVVRSVRFLPALEAAALLLIEPVLNPVWAWLLQGERPGPNILAGGAAILAGTLGGSVRPAKARPAAQ